MPAQDNCQLVRRLVEEAQQNGRFDVLDELLADDFVDHTPLPGLPPTRDGVRLLFGAMLGAFPDLRITIHEQVADEAKVVTRKSFEGTHRGAFIGVEPTGNRISFEAIDILTVSEGKIREHRVIFDQLGLLQQLGAISAH
jgi:steroid delta-isomerase-like uncharacterized protein